ncbi:juvenile hormone acid O-methyltransferase-like [Rhipicephalus sanguineus]|uniref:juvenile hormone acid O-methyltransferase-like n=1 Tax=Rhipicephalus sanguineus TaxID=34632 RepID=UPI0020C3CC9E|nr:juvenile hormone acid O-methyltransferase-like [Rhipicephalus sanguineus]
MGRLDTTLPPRGPITECHNSESYSRRELMNPAGYANHETYLWQLDQSALDRTEFLAQPQAHHQHLDVGCGTGGFTFRALQPLSRPARRIMGVDVSPSMLEFALRHNSQGSIAYELLDIASPTEVSAFVTKNGQFQRVYSFLCFHLVPDQTVAFRNISNLMAADGECLVTAGVTNPAFDAWLDIHAMPEWKRYVTVMAASSYQT